MEILRKPKTTNGQAIAQMSPYTKEQLGDIIEKIKKAKADYIAHVDESLTVLEEQYNQMTD